MTILLLHVLYPCLPLFSYASVVRLSVYSADAPVLLLLFPLKLHNLSHSPAQNEGCGGWIAIGVSPCRLSAPYAPADGLLPTATAAVVAAAWALLPSTSTGCCVRYSLLVCCCCATLLLLWSSYFSRHSSPWNHPPYMRTTTTTTTTGSPIFSLCSAKPQTAKATELNRHTTRMEV